MDVAGMQNARLGMLYLWQGTKVNSSLATTILGGVIGSTGAIGGAVGYDFPVPDMAVDIVGGAADSASSSDKTGFAAILEWAKGFVSGLWAKMKDQFGSVGDIGGALKNIALFVAGEVFKSVSGIIGASAGLVQGLWNFTTTFCEKISNWKAKNDVKLNFGHPKTLVKGIERGLTMGMLEGLYKIAKNAVMITLHVFTAGAAVIVDAIAAVAEAAVKILWRIGEYYCFKHFTASAKNYWISKTPGRGIHMDSKKFDDWIRPITKKIPLVAAVSLGSGIVGDKMRFLQMYAGDGQIISKSDFKSGVKYLDQMKRAGSRLMERSDIEFGSDDVMIAGLLKLAQSHQEVHTNKKGFFAKLFRTTDKIMRA